MSDKN